jgi:uncharacterized small protein (DUF1192 family)
MDIAKGVTVRVVRGKKVPVGTTGIVVWSGPGHYGPRVGIKPAGGGEALFTDAKNVEVVGADAPAPAPQAALPFDTDAGAVATLQARIATLEARLEALEALAAKAAARRAAAAAPVAA